GLGVLLSAVVFRGGVVGTLGLLVERWQPSDSNVSISGIDETPEPIATQADAASVPRVAPDGALPLVVQGVSKRFGGNTALTSVDLEVRPGEILGVIG